MFEAYLRFLAWRGYHTVRLDELHAHLTHGASLPDRPIVLTFDDGYLDNWVYAVPYLRKYGFTATVFAATDFVQDGTEPRPTMDDVWQGRVKEEDLDAYGFMNRAELEAAADEGVLDVQSHGRTHTWLPVSDRVIGFHNPGGGLRHARWMWWNAYPERKPHWFREFSMEDIPWGTPIYDNALALSQPAVAPDPELAAHLVSLVEREGGARFFENADWSRRLEREVESYRARHPAQAVTETGEAFEARLRDELEGSRLELEQITGHPVRFMCWPNGGVCQRAYDLLEPCGYVCATYPSSERQKVNTRGTRPDRIGRISATSYFRGTHRVFPWALSFALKVERNRGNWLATIPIRLIWLYRRLVPAAGGKPLGADL